MKDRKPPAERVPTEELIEAITALEREQSTAQDLNRRHTEDVKKSRLRDRQVLIERRRHPR
jgi:hypothetical protein